MSLSPFETSTASLSTSITMDASTVGRTTVTVAVCSSRDEELDILDSIYHHGGEIGFKPFYNKANDFTHEIRRDFTDALVRDLKHHIVAFTHNELQDGNTDTAQVEAIHSAIHVHDLLEREEESPLVIVDGNEQQAAPFLKALSGLRTDLPTVAHCQKSESYYPTALLADLASNHLAHQIENAVEVGREPELPIRVPNAKRARGREWGVAASSMYQSEPEYTPPTLPALHGATVRERVNCWYQGAVSLHSGLDRPMTDSLTPIVNTLHQEGYEDLAETLRQL